MNEPRVPPAPRLRLGSEVRETTRLHAWIDGLLTADVLPPPLENAVRLCLEEAVINVIMHGYGKGRRGEIDVQLWREPGELRAIIVDSAPPFDPVTAPRPDAKANPSGGRGLRILRRFASGLAYERRDGTNRLAIRWTAPE